MPFLDAIATDWLERAGTDPLEIGRGLILLPTRRAARALAEAFLRVSRGRPLLLPRITAFGAVDEAPLALAGTLDLPPAVEPARRLAALSRLILKLRGANGAPRTADRAWKLAAELAALMDEAERAEIDLPTRLPDAVDPDYASHWAQTLEFLHIVTRHWPDWLAEQGMMNPAARLVALLNTQAAAWEALPPLGRVLAAGSTGAIPAVARLLKVVAHMPNGAVALPGLDMTMSDETWAGVDDGHPQAALARLLHGLGATRDDVRLWTRPGILAEPSRAATLSRALLPATALFDWRSMAPPAIDGLALLTAAEEQEEAAAIALVLREALETPGATAALVTPDRDLAGRVATELLRYGIVADDSAGESLSESPPAVFLRLVAQAVTEELAPVALLGLLKHPLCAAGLSPVACRAAARALELACLRGPRPHHGLTGLRRALDRARPEPVAADLLRRIETCLEPVLRIDSAIEVEPSLAFAALIEAAERLAASDAISGPGRLWAGEEGEALATRLAEVQEALSLLPDQRRDVLPGLLDAVLEGAVVRSRRALRGRGGTEHPRVFIWGLLEARLQSADVMILGGLVEGVWPPTSDPGAWLSRPMRGRIGLPSPEEVIGQSAHDFVSCATAAPKVVLSCPKRRDGAPVVPARWLTRLQTFLAAHGMALPQHPASTWVRVLDQPANEPRPVRPPRPRPPVALRPRRLSVTEIETWLRDPYAIHAKHILRLARLRPLDEATDAADYGSLVHKGLHLFLERHQHVWPADATEQLQRAMARALAEADLREALTAWWAPRLQRIAEWVAQVETARRADSRLIALVTEASGTLELARPGGLFRLTGRADRIERRCDGGLAILDYKTGTPPTQKEVDAGLAPQLLLEATMAEAGAFGADISGQTSELTYWHLTGGFQAGEVRTLFKEDVAAIQAAISDARDALCGLIDAYDAPDRRYLSQPQPRLAPRYPEYAQLARVAEWAVVGDEE